MAPNAKALLSGQTDIELTVAVHMEAHTAVIELKGVEVVVVDSLTASVNALTLRGTIKTTATMKAAVLQPTIAVSNSTAATVTKHILTEALTVKMISNFNPRNSNSQAGAGSLLGEVKSVTSNNNTPRPSPRLRPPRTL